MWPYIIWTILIFIAYLAIRWPYFKLPISADSGFYVSNSTIINKKIDFSRGWNAHYALGSKFLVEYFYSLVYLWFGNKKYKKYSRFFFSCYNYLTGIVVGLCAFYFINESLLVYLIGLIIYCLISSEPHYGVYFESGDQFEPLFQALGMLFITIGASSTNNYLIALGVFCWFANAVLVKISGLPPAIIVAVGVIVINKTHFGSLAPLIVGDIIVSALLYCWILSKSKESIIARLSSVFRHEIIMSKTANDKKKLSRGFLPLFRCLQKTKQTLIIMAINPIIPCLAIGGLILMAKTTNGTFLLLLLWLIAVLSQFYISFTPIWYYNIPFLPIIALLAVHTSNFILSSWLYGAISLWGLLILWFVRNLIFIKLKNVKWLANYVWYFQVRTRGEDSYQSDCIAPEIEKIISPCKTMFIYGHNELYVLTGRSYDVPFNTAMSYTSDLEPRWQEKLHQQMINSPPDYLLDALNYCDVDAIKNNLGLDYQLAKAFGDRKQIKLYRLAEKSGRNFKFNINFESLITN